MFCKNTYTPIPHKKTYNSRYLQNLYKLKLGLCLICLFNKLRIFITNLNGKKKHNLKKIKQKSENLQSRNLKFRMLLDKAQN